MRYFIDKAPQVISQGYLEVALVSALACATTTSTRITLIVPLAELVLCACNSRPEISLAFCLLFTILGEGVVATCFLFTCLLVVCFPNQNFFQYSLFGALMGWSLYMQLGQRIPTYLIHCLILQVVLVSALKGVGVAHSCLFYFLVFFNVASGLCSLVLGIHKDLLDSPHLVQVGLYGVVGLLSTVLLSIAAGKSRIPNIYVRKIFHIPPLILLPVFDRYYPDIFLTSVVGIIYLFVILEFLRFYSIGLKDSLLLKFLRRMWAYMERFLDSRDKQLWVTHLSLLIGMVISYTLIEHPLVRNASVILPVGDAFAAIFGKKYGRVKIGQKSLEGTFAFVASVLVVFYMGGHVMGVRIDWIKLGIAVVATGLVQLASRQVDNLLLPLVFSLIYMNL